METAETATDSDEQQDKLTPEERKEADILKRLIAEKQQNHPDAKPSDVRATLISTAGAALRLPGYEIQKRRVLLAHIPSWPISKVNS